MTRVREVPQRLFAALPSALLVLALAASPSQATLIGGPGPGPDFLSDDGTEFFFPVYNTSLGCHCSTFLEEQDPFGVVPHEWGFFFESDPNTRIPIFDVADDGATEQAVVNFDGGAVFDFEASAVQATFTPSLGAVGFYLTVDFPDPDPDLLLYSSAALNPGGTDTTASFPTVASPTNYLIAFEANDTVLSLESADRLTPVPEPSSNVLLAGGLVAVGLRRRALQRSSRSRRSAASMRSASPKDRSLKSSFE